MKAQLGLKKNSMSLPVSIGHYCTGKKDQGLQDVRADSALKKKKPYVA
jgi:hypothetical protein